MASFNKIRMGALTTPAESISEPLRIAQLAGETERSLKQLDQKPQVSTDAVGSTKQSKSQVELTSLIFFIKELFSFKEIGLS
jgi:hypothetical protein